MGDGHPGIRGHLDIFGGTDEGVPHVFIHGDPEGLRSLAKLLISLADEQQDNYPESFTGFQEHVHLEPDYDISNSSHRTIVGRLDGARTGEFPPRYIARTKSKYRKAT